MEFFINSTKDHIFFGILAILTIDIGDVLFVEMVRYFLNQEYQIISIKN